MGEVAALSKYIFDNSKFLEEEMSEKFFSKGRKKRKIIA